MPDPLTPLRKAPHVPIQWGDSNPLARFSDEELAAELKRRKEQRKEEE